jgi:hypothetical protein
VPLLGVASAMAAIGAVVGAVFWGQWISAIGWLLAGPIAIGVLALFMSRDTLRRSAPVYLRPNWITAVYSVVMLLIAIGVVVSAFGFAIWVGRR